MKRMILTMIALLGLSLAPGYVHADNQPDSDLRLGAALHNIAISTGLATPVMTLYYVGTASESVLSVFPTSMTLSAPWPTLDTTVNGDGVFDFTVSSLSTLGQVCAQINNSTTYRCVLGGYTSTTTARVMLDGNGAGSSSNNGKNLKASGGYVVNADTGSAVASSQALFVEAVGITPLDPNHRIVLRKCVANIADSAGSIKVYGKLRQFEGIPVSGVPQLVGVANIVGVPNGGGAGTPNDNTLVFNQLGAAANVDGAIDFSLAQYGGGLAFAKGAHVVVTAGNGTTAQATANYVWCLWDELLQ